MIPLCGRSTAFGIPADAAGLISVYGIRALLVERCQPDHRQTIATITYNGIMALSLLTRKNDGIEK
jgi:hypothetical protein